MRLLFVLAAIVASISVASSARVYCRLSGDPHYTTWDGVRHDYQGQGLFHLASSNHLKVQAQFQRCNPRARHPVSCVRSVAVQITESIGTGRVRTPKTVTIKWGSFYKSKAYPAQPPAFPNPTPAQPAVVDVVSINGVNMSDVSGCVANSNGWEWECPHTSLTGVTDFLENRYYFRYRSGKIQIVERSSVDPLYMLIGRFYYLGYIKVEDRNFGMNGLCGHFDTDASNEFVAPNGTLMRSGTVRGRRYNDAPVREWGNLWSITSQSESIMSSYHHHELFGMTTQNVPPAVTVDAAAQQILDEVNFQSISTVQTAEATCKQQNPDNQADFEDCLYDVAAVNKDDSSGSFELASSNSIASAAQKEANAPDSSASSTATTGTTVGITFGVIAFVTLVIAGVLFMRLKRTKQDLSRALVLASQGHSSSNVHMQGTQDEIHLSDNL